MGTSTPRRIIPLLIALLLVCAGRTPAAQQNPRISARDQLTVTVFGVKDFSKKYPVSADGFIEFPEIGRVKVAGLTVREAEDLLTKKLKESVLVNPQVTAELEQTPNKKITINGSVRTPGTVTYAGEMTLLEALVKAGGRLPEAADEVLILRMQPAGGQPGSDKRAPQRIAVNARELENGQLSGNEVLQDGDVISVRKAQPVTVTGYVRTVGAYTIESGMNVEQVLALAGGIDPLRGSDKRIEIIRKIDGKSVTIKDVKKTDVVQPGDIIRVGRRVV